MNSMNETEVDLFVIGGGSGGVRGARMAAATGARVAIAENYRYGGTCVIRGCVPKKLLVYASHVSHDLADAKGFGWDIPMPSFSWQRLIENKDREIDRLESVYDGLLGNAGVEMLKGTARFLDPHRVAVGDRVFRAKHILIASGGHPVKPDGDGWEHAVTSNELFHLKELPPRVLIYGAGYIGVEFAGIFNGLGSKVSLVYRRSPVLRGFDCDIRLAVTKELERQGIVLHLERNIEAIEPVAEGYGVLLSDGTRLETDLVVAATGRRPNTASLDLGKAGVETKDNGAVKVDDFSRTSQSHIFAVGDVTDRVALTPVAIEEAMAFVDTVFHNRPRALDHSLVPAAVFTQPPVGTVGLGEDEARAKYGRIEVYKSEFRPLKHTLSGSGERSLMKLIVEPESRRVLGAHMVGSDAPEIVQGVAVAILAGATKEVFDATVGIHPTAAEEFVTMRTPVAEPTAEAAE